MSRAGAVITKDNTVALIKRTRENKVYYMFPGGQKENNETFEETCIREIKEELGVDIVIDRQIAEVKS
jgi:ADP-ribose pyrophosphatase YjhB (NUDIX family)